MTIEPIEIVVVLDMTPSRAFEIFVGDIDRWWPKVPFSRAEGRVTLPRGTGDIIETAADGTRHLWGRVTSFEAPSHLAIDWMIGGSADAVTTIDVRFEATDDGRTGVTLIHDNWHHLGAEGAAARDSHAGGWARILGDGYRAFAHAQASNAPQPERSP